MSVKKFIQSVLSSLNIDEFNDKSKKKSIKTLLKKLKKRRLELYKKIKKETRSTKLAKLNEDLSVVSVLIKKGKKILNDIKEGNL